jgi:hypothetical protein
MTSAEMRDGYVQLFNDVYAADAYFARMDDLLLNSCFKHNRFDSNAKSSLWHRLKVRTVVVCWSVVACVALVRRIPDSLLRQEYRRRIRSVLARGGFWSLFRYTWKCVTHYHYYTMAREMKQGTAYNSF